MSLVLDPKILITRLPPFGCEVLKSWRVIQGQESYVKFIQSGGMAP
jgi:hypothetical protein